MRGGSHFVMGHSHSVCEDYAASTDTFAALSDGCSVVKDEEGNRIDPHTDIGARLLVCAAMKLQKTDPGGLTAKIVVHGANDARRLLNLPEETLSATLLMLTDMKGYILAEICGDGAVAARVAGTSQWCISTVLYQSRPFYPRYLLSDHGVGDFQQSTGGLFTVNTTNPDGSECTQASSVRQRAWSTFQYETLRYDLVVAMSDGAFSFTQDGRSVTFDQTLAGRLLDFRRMKGDFMVRHLRGVLKELAQDGIVSQDDLSMIALYED